MPKHHVHINSLTHTVFELVKMHCNTSGQNTNEAFVRYEETCKQLFGTIPFPKSPVPQDKEHYCLTCLRSPGRDAFAHTHYLMDCPWSRKGRHLLLGRMNDTLKNRLYAPEDRDSSATNEKFVNMFEALYQLKPSTPALRSSTPGVTVQPTPNQPEHRCTRCGLTNGADHYTLDCPLLTEPEHTQILEEFHRVLKDRCLRSEDRTPSFPQLINTVESYYGLAPTDLSNPVEKDTTAPEIKTSCPDLCPLQTTPQPSEHPVTNIEHPNSKLDDDDCRSDTSECPDPNCELCLLAFHPDREVPTQAEADVSLCAELGQGINDSDPTNESFCSDRLQSVYTFTHQDNDTRVPSPQKFDNSQRAPLSEAGENIDSKVSPTEGTKHTLATGSLLPEQGKEQTHHTKLQLPSQTTPQGLNNSERTPLLETGEHMDSEASPTKNTTRTVATGSPLDKMISLHQHLSPMGPQTSDISDQSTSAALAQSLSDTHPQKLSVSSPIATTGEEKRRTSPNDVEHHLLDELSTKIEGFHQNTDCLGLADRQHSSLVTDKALNITRATGPSERGPDSNENQVEDYCDHQNEFSNLGEPHRYGIALSDPYLKVVPPPPINQTTGLTQPDGLHICSWT